jgi:hypothetical protein
VEPPTAANTGQRRVPIRTKPKEEQVIEVRIGIIESPKELILELEEESKELIDKVNSALEEGSGLVWLTDSKGKQIAVSAGRIAYLEIEAERPRTVGFGG